MEPSRTYQVSEVVVDVQRGVIDLENHPEHDGVH